MFTRTQIDFAYLKERAQTIYSFLTHHLIKKPSWYASDKQHAFYQSFQNIIAAQKKLLDELNYHYVAADQTYYEYARFLSSLNYFRQQPLLADEIKTKLTRFIIKELVGLKDIIWDENKSDEENLPLALDYLNQIALHPSIEDFNFSLKWELHKPKNNYCAWNELVKNISQGHWVNAEDVVVPLTYMYGVAKVDFDYTMENYVAKYTVSDFVNEQDAWQKNKLEYNLATLLKDFFESCLNQAQKNQVKEQLLSIVYDESSFVHSVYFENLKKLDVMKKIKTMILEPLVIFLNRIQMKGKQEGISVNCYSGDENYLWKIIFDKLKKVVIDHTPYQSTNPKNTKSEEAKKRILQNYQIIFDDAEITIVAATNHSSKTNFGKKILGAIRNIGNFFGSCLRSIINGLLKCFGSRKSQPISTISQPTSQQESTVQRINFEGKSFTDIHNELSRNMTLPTEKAEKNNNIKTETKTKSGYNSPKNLSSKNVFTKDTDFSSYTERDPLLKNKI